MRQSKRSSRDLRPAAPAFGRVSNLARRGAVARALSAVFGRPEAESLGRRGIFEPLEERRLLTTVFGGETLTFLSTDFGQLPQDIDDFIPVVVEIQGPSDAQVELYGASFGLEGSQLGDLSGNLDSPDPDRDGPIRGGIGGGIGSDTLVPTGTTFISEGGGLQDYSVTDYIGSDIPSLPQGVLLAPQDAIAFSKLATNDAGQTYGVQIAEFDVNGNTVRQLQLAQFNTDVTDSGGPGPMRDIGDDSSLGAQTNVGDAVFIDDLFPSIIDALTGTVVDPTAPVNQPAAEAPLGDDEVLDQADIQNIVGADFAPGDNNTLYLLINVNTRRLESNTGPQGEAVVPVLVAVDVTGGTVGDSQLIASDFPADPQSRDAETIANITAFAIGNPNGDFAGNRVFLYGTFNERINEFSGNQQIVSTTGITNVPLALRGTTPVQRQAVLPVDGAVPIELEVRPDSSFVYGLIGGDNDNGAQLIRINPTTGASDTVGGINDFGGLGAGGNVTSLTWDPTFANPFTGAGDGTFLGFDTGVDQLLTIDQRPRGSAGALSLYNITVVNADSNTRIVVYALDDDGNPIPYEGNPNPVAERGDNDLALPDGTGPLYLGFKFITEETDEVITIPSLDVTTTEGTGAFAGTSYGGRVRPGFYVEGNDSNGDAAGGVLTGTDIGGFYFGGVVTGNVRVEGSIGELYAGAILTGDASEDGGFDAYQADNFAVYGSVNSVVSNFGIGSDADGEGTGTADYDPGTDFAIGGRLGQLRAGARVNASFDVRNDRPGDDFLADNTFYTQLDNTRSEIEATGPNPGAAFPGASLINAATTNDTFATYEPLGSDLDGTVVVQGALTIGDAADYYGIPAMAGQVMTFRLADSTGAGSGGQLGIFDPQGRLVASTADNNDQTAALTAASAIQVQATSAGTYRAAVLGGSEYQLTITGLGDIGFGGVRSNNAISLNNAAVSGDSLRLLQGDIGTLDGTLGSVSGASIVRATNGNIRSVTGNSVGLGIENIPGNYSIAQESINLRAGGSIGRLEGTNAGDPATGGYVFYNFGDVLDADGLPILEEAVGDDIQVIRAARDVLGNFIVGRGIGSIVAGRDFGSAGGPNGSIRTNVDDINDDGFVDIVSVGRNFGAVYDQVSGSFISTTGPGIDMGSNGNFRYLDLPARGAPGVGFTGRDPFFGGTGVDDFTNLDVGQTFDFTDDSGTSVTIDAGRGRINPDFTPGTTGSDQFIGTGTLSLLTYPVRSGGAIMVTVNSDRDFVASTNARGTNDTVEFGNVRLSGDGRPVINARDQSFNGADDTTSVPTLRSQGSTTQPNSLPGDAGDDLNDVNVRLSGGNVDVFSIDATNFAGNGGKLTNVVNNSRGEILDLSAASVALLQADRIGVPLTRGTAALEAVTDRVVAALGLPFTGWYPFDQQEYLIGVQGGIAELRGEQIGNVFAGINLGYTLAGAFDTSAGTGGGGTQGGTGTGGNTGTGTGGNTGGGGIGTGGVGGAFTAPPVRNITVGGVDFGDLGNNNGGPVIGRAGDGIGNSNGSVAGTAGRFTITPGTTGELTGIIQRVSANDDGRNDPNVFEGIVAPVIAATPDAPDIVGEIRFVDVGEGLVSDGSGTDGRGLIGAEAFVVQVQANNADIRGDVIGTEINEVLVDNGSIIGADVIATVLSNSPVEPFTNFPNVFGGGGGGETAETDDADGPVYELDRVRVTGNGGILGSTFTAADLDTVEVDGGFGILRSNILAFNEGTVNRVETDGLGLRNVTIGGARNVNTVTANGDAGLLNLKDYSIEAQYSGFADRDFEPFSGVELNAGNDLRLAVGLPRDVFPRRRRVTNSGVLENVRITGNGDLGSLTGSVSRSNTNADFPTENFEENSLGIGDGNPLGDIFPNTVNFGRNVGEIDVLSSFGLQVTAGELDSFSAQDDLLNTNLRTSGRIRSVTAGGLIDGDSFLRADGPDGVIETVRAGAINATVSAAVAIQDVVVDGDLGAPTPEPKTVGQDQSTFRSLGRIDSLRVLGSILTGAYVRAGDNIGSLFVDGDVEDGAIVQANSIGDLTVNGTIFGSNPVPVLA